MLTRSRSRQHFIRADATYLRNPRVPLTLPLWPAFGDGRGDMSQIRRSAWVRSFDLTEQMTRGISPEQRIDPAPLLPFPKAPSAVSVAVHIPFVNNSKTIERRQFSGCPLRMNGPPEARPAAPGEPARARSLDTGHIPVLGDKDTLLQPRRRANHPAALLTNTSR
jgi:hypothetical protein